jgi:prepilin-type processing-associated H-X9-DG protein
MLLPFVEQEDVYRQFDLRYAYNDTTAPSNQVAARSVISTYICPSNPVRPASGQDSEGYGFTDYLCTSYTDIDPTTGVRNRNTRVNGGLHATSVPYPPGQSNGASDTSTYVPHMPWTNTVTNLPYVMTQLGPRVGDITDGLSKTIAFAEDAGRQDKTVTSYQDPIGGSESSGERASWRWAEPNSASGVSGDPLATADQFGTLESGFSGTIKAINNNSKPFGGGICDWNFGYDNTSNPNNSVLPGYTGGTNTNCGPNNEVFGFHGAGANVLFLDGHVSFLSEDVNSVVVRYLVTAAEGIPIPSGTDY